MNSKILYGMCFASFALLCAIGYLLINAATAAPASNQDVVSVSQISPGAPVDVTNISPLEDLVTVNDPFKGERSKGMVMSTSRDDLYSDLIVSMDYLIAAPTVTTLDGDFENTIMSNTSVTSDEKISIVHNMRYSEESVLVWTPTTSDTFNWNQDPSRESIPFGTFVSVTYSTDNATGQWVGDITIEKPQG